MTTRPLPVFGLAGMDSDERSRFVSALRDEAVASIDRLHGAIFELEDLRELGQTEAGLCDSVFHRAQELCGHKAFRQ